MPSKRFVLLLVLAAALSGCFQRTPPETVPDAVRPDGTPVAPRDTGPRPRVVHVAGSQNESPFYIEAMVTAHITANEIVGGTGAFPNPPFNGTMIGVEGLIQPLRGRGIGVAGKAVSAGSGSPAYTNIELLLGARSLAFGLGLGTRSGLDLLTTGAYDSTFTVFSPALRSRVNLGATGVSVASKAVRYFNLPDSRTPNPKLWGWNAEASMAWTAKRLPITASLGYRHELFRVYDRKHTLHSLVIGGGMLFGRQPGARVAPDSTDRR